MSGVARTRALTNDGGRRNTNRSVSGLPTGSPIDQVVVDNVATAVTDTVPAVTVIDNGPGSSTRGGGGPGRQRGCHVGSVVGRLCCSVVTASDGPVFESDGLVAGLVLLTTTGWCWCAAGLSWIEQFAYEPTVVIDDRLAWLLVFARRERYARMSPTPTTTVTVLVDTAVARAYS